MVKLDIVRSGSAYVFEVNGSQIWTDSSYEPATSMPNDFIMWVSTQLGSPNMTAAVNSFGVPVPEPGTLARWRPGWPACSATRGGSGGSPEFDD